MEEVDKIIIHSLRQVGCDLEEADSLKQFSTEMVIEAAVRCLDVIQPGLGLPHSLPPNMSARFRVGASIAQACMDLGYPGEIGYQTFLYSSEADVRRVFMFLIEKLPKETEKTIVDPTVGGAELLEQQVAEEVRRQLCAPWLPSYCRQEGLRWRNDGSWSREGCRHCKPFLSNGFLHIPDANNQSEAYQEYIALHLPSFPEQVNPDGQILPALITTNAFLLHCQCDVLPSARSLKKWPQQFSDCLLDGARQNSHAPGVESVPRARAGPKPPVKQKPAFLQKTSQKEAKNEVIPAEIIAAERTVPIPEPRKTQQQLIEEGRKETEELCRHIEELELDIRSLNAKLAQISGETVAEDRTLQEQKDRLAVKQRTYELLPEADENLAKLQSLVENSAQRLVGLAAQWEKHRAPLLARYRELRHRNSSRASESQKQADAIRTLREKMRELTDEVHSKEELHTQLLADYEKVSKDTNTVSRTAYTRRIMEIIGNIRKQRDEIAKVLADTRELQKEINTLSGQLERSFTVADELIFRDAKKDEVSRRAYKLLATLHSDCSELVQMVEETGAIIREIRDLEEQIETETAKNVGSNLERVSADLRQMQQENAALTAQLKSKAQTNQV
ncbi:coiled-coil domain-containing protein 22 homolog isoform X1 [Schistocerca piceifrons]|uniref:coiled-coil domain-containing protein 22 homolog isoform X1 n=1 Tax=Schistocerca piceifrons TaxID=274613 RepID=UPI001F5E60E3|nr:coiled-coil domain-containing protein 22 homolog isoform X1 [Schistocerca piceifrons]